MCKERERKYTVAIVKYRPQIHTLVLCDSPPKSFTLDRKNLNQIYSFLFFLMIYKWVQETICELMVSSEISPKVRKKTLCLQEATAYGQTANLSAPTVTKFQVLFDPSLRNSS